GVRGGGGIAVGQPELHNDLLQAQRACARGEEPDDRVEVGDRDVHHRPDVEQYPVPVQLGQGRVGGSGGAQAVQAGVERALDLGYAPDPALGVAQDGQVADVGQGDEPLVDRDIAALHAEQVHVGRGGQ